MTHLRKMMLEELERRNYSQSTTRTYLQTMEDFAPQSVDSVNKASRAFRVATKIDSRTICSGPQVVST